MGTVGGAVRRICAPGCRAGPKRPPSDAASRKRQAVGHATDRSPLLPTLQRVGTGVGTTGPMRCAAPDPSQRPACRSVRPDGSTAAGVSAVPPSSGAGPLSGSAPDDGRPPDGVWHGEALYAPLLRRLPPALAILYNRRSGNSVMQATACSGNKENSWRDCKREISADEFRRRPVFACRGVRRTKDAYRRREPSAAFFLQPVVLECGQACSRQTCSRHKRRSQPEAHNQRRTQIRIRKPGRTDREAQTETQRNEPSCRRA